MHSWSTKPARLCAEGARCLFSSAVRFTAPDLATAHHWVNVLNAVGISCELHKPCATGALGGLLPDISARPRSGCMTSATRRWRGGILEGGTFRAAGGRDALALRPLRRGARRTQFTVCWHCGRTRDPRDEEAGPED